MLLLIWHIELAMHVLGSHAYERAPPVRVTGNRIDAVRQRPEVDRVCSESR